MNPRPESAQVPADRTSAYEPPAVAWEEDFEPAGQATGCSDNVGNCNERPEVV